MKTMPSLATLTLTSMLSLSAMADVRDEITKTFDIGTEGTIRLSNINGDVSFRSCSCDQVTVNAVIEASDQEARDRIKVEMDTSGNRLDIKTQYEKNRSHNHGKSKVTYSLEIPATTRLKDVELVNGNLNIENITGELEASLVNGRLESEGLASDTKVNTVNGTMELRFSSLSQVNDIELASVNGKINLYLPPNAGARINANTVNGGIDNEFGINVKKHKFVGSSMEGSIGNGSTDIELETVNGKINVDKN